jgi:hypothetical protein
VAVASQKEQKEETKQVKINVAPGASPSKQAAIEDSSFGDVSSIMIMPDQIYNNNFNLLDDEEAEEEENRDPAGSAVVVSLNKKSGAGLKKTSSRV